MYNKGDKVIPNLEEIDKIQENHRHWKIYSVFGHYVDTKLHTVQWCDGQMIKLTGVNNPIDVKYVKLFVPKYEDAAGKVLNIGDAVLYIKPSYRELVKGYIVRLGPKQASVGDEPNAEYTIGRDYSYIAKI